MRLFVGIPCPPSPALAAAAQELGETMHGARVVPSENLHLTLRFLGEVADPEPIAAALRAELSHAAALRGGVVGLGAFPSEWHARVAWAGVVVPGLDALAARVRFATQDQGEPAGKPFAAHLTLARLPQPRDLRAWCARHAGEAWGPLAVDAVVLYRSRMGPGGSVYEALATIPLVQPDPAVPG